MEKEPKHRNCKDCGKSFPVYKLNRCDRFDGYCKKCIEKLELQEKLESVIPKHYRKAHIKKLSVGLQDDIKHLDGKGLFLWGIPSVGKTYAMCALARKYIHQGFDVRRINWDMLSLKIRATFGGPTVKHKTESGRCAYDYGEGEDGEAMNTQWDVMKPFLQADMLFVEDIGTGKSIGRDESDFVIGTFTTLLNERYENDLPTFITSNKNLEEIKKSFDERIADRIHEVCEIVQLTGKNRRYKEHS